jgi:flagellar biosynthesis/type III secretory pathway protein FliH
MNNLDILFEIDDIFERAPASAAAHTGILFVEDFDIPEETPQPIPAPEETPEIIAPVFSFEDYTAACNAAREAGTRAGREEALQETAVIQQQLQTAALAGINDALAAGQAERHAASRRMADELAHTLLAMLAAALPATSQALAGSETAALLQAILPPLNREPELHIEVHPSLLETITAALLPFRQTHRGALHLTGRETLAPADVIVRWAEGEATRDTRTLWANIRAALALFALPSDPSTDFLKDNEHGGQYGE